MPKSKKRKKNGRPVGTGEDKNRRAHNERLKDQPTGVTFQDLINIVAYQEYEARGELPSQKQENEDGK